MIWQRTAQDRLTWRLNAEALPNHGIVPLWLPNDDVDDLFAVYLCFLPFVKLVSVKYVMS